MRVILIAWALIFTVSATAYGQEQILTPLGFNEQVRGDAPVAGELLRSVHVGEAARRVRLEDLRVYVPRIEYSHLYLEVETQDARYYARATYLISEAQRDRRCHVNFPTHHRRLLEGLPIRDVAFLAYVSNAAGSPDRLYLPVEWQSTENAPIRLLFLVNARAPSVDVRIYDKQTRRFFRCDKDTASKRRTAFDTECFVDLDRRGEPVTLVLIRDRFQNRDEDEIKIFLP